CTNQPTILRTPRVPALGQASDTCNDGRTAEAKKTGFNRWRQFGQPAMQIVFRGANHFWWSAAASTTQHDIANYYTQNWFDRWLKGDTGATSRLLSRSVNSTPLETLLSQNFASGVFFDGYSCDDLRTACQPSNQTATITGRVINADGRGIANARVRLSGDYFSSPRYALTNPFGYYRFVNVPVFFVYRATVSAKNRSFTQPFVVLNITGNATDINFTSSN
ncbi:MAG TPA: carboxypeptidase-like regulatory domain-containing protein, partial [Pyrinomonadaceae bacterium]|nr:carboxypeptidase-like regulatory domain-containing protein [Pyrinomonadaceae bacterium]